MDDLSEVWRLIQKVSGILLLVGVSLYLVRCVVGFQIVSFDQFDHFLRGLFAYIVK